MRIADSAHFAVSVFTWYPGQGSLPAGRQGTSDLQLTLLR